MRDPFKTWDADKLEQLRNFKDSGVPMEFRVIKERMEKCLEAGVRILVIDGEHANPQSAVVVVLDKVFDRFAVGHMVNKLAATRGDTSIPYTISYSSFLDKSNRTRYVLEEA